MGSRASKENEKLSCDAETRRKSRVLAFLTGTANKRVMKAAGNIFFRGCIRVEGAWGWVFRARRLFTVM